MGTVIKGKPYQPPTAEEIQVLLNEFDQSYYATNRQHDMHVLIWRFQQQLPSRPTDDEFDDDQYSQEQGDGFIY